MADESGPGVVRYLDPAAIRLERSPGGVLRLTTGDRCYRRVQILRAFPVSRPDGYLSFRSGDEEIGLLRGLDELAADQRALVEAELERRYFTPRIRAVMELVDQSGSYQWRTWTDRGEVTFVSQHPRRCAVPLADGQWLITDEDSNRYLLPNPAALDRRSRQLVTALLG